MNRTAVSIALAFLTLLGIRVEAAQGPLKVFILAGQSNMQGHANVRTFDYIGKDPKTAPMLKEMLGPDGAPKVCDRVWISYISPDRGDARGEPQWLKDERGYTKHDQPGELFNVHDDLAEGRNYFAEKPEVVRELKTLLEKYKADGRSTPGAKQPNDLAPGSKANGKNPRSE